MAGGALGYELLHRSMEAARTDAESHLGTTLAWGEADVELGSTGRRKMNLQAQREKRRTIHSGTALSC